jgi:hypothetical protein
MRRRAESAFEVALLREFGGAPDLLIMRNEVGLFYTRDGRPVRIGSPGSPDLVASVSGVWLGLELKSETGRVSEDQARWHEAARQRGALVEVVRTVDEARTAIEQARRRRAR